MPIPVRCRCGASYTLKDEFAGQRLACPNCGAEIVAGSAVPVAGMAPDVAPQADPVFDRDVFLLRQQHFAISEKYYVNDERGEPICFIQRPAHLAQTFVALLAAALAVIVWWIGVAAVASAIESEDAQAVVFAVGFFGMFGVLLLSAAPLMPLRHVTFYRDDSKREALLEILQDSKYQMIRPSFTVRDPRGRVVARLHKNYLRDILRRRWQCFTAEGKPLCEANEDSIILSMLRRVLGTFYGLLRTNFIITRPHGEVIGEFNRKITILDRYVLDLKGDRRRTLDRRIALAIGVMLDTGERR